MNYKSSLIGFHNPYLHKGLTLGEFLDEYIKSLKKRTKKRTKKKNGAEISRLIKWIVNNYER